MNRHPPDEKNKKVVLSLLHSYYIYSFSSPSLISTPYCLEKVTDRFLTEGVRFTSVSRSLELFSFRIALKITCGSRHLSLLFL